MRSRPDEERVFSPGRRRFLTWLTVACGGVAAALPAVPVVGFVLAPAWRRPQQSWRAVARRDELAVGETVKVTFADPETLPWAGFAAHSAAWLRREAPDRFVAFSIYCTHTGCPVRWEGGAELFLCPCHGGVFYRDGSVAAGPPRTPLVRHPVRLRRGVVELQTIGVPVPEE